MANETDKRLSHLESESSEMTESMRDVWKALMGDNTRPDEAGFFEKQRLMRLEIDLVRADVKAMRNDFMERLAPVAKQTETNKVHLEKFNLRLAGVIGGITVIGWAIQFWLSYRQGK